MVALLLDPHISAYADSSIVQQFSLEKLLGPKGGMLLKSEFRRYRLPAGGTTVHYELMSDERIELPSLNYAQNGGQEYRFAYGASQHKTRTDDFFNQLVKVDLVQGSTSLWFEEGTYPGEPVFVASPKAIGEDDGVILSIVLDGKKDTSFLLVLDAASFTELARAELPHHIPFGFHGIYNG